MHAWRSAKPLLSSPSRMADAARTHESGRRRGGRCLGTTLGCRQRPSRRRMEMSRHVAPSEYTAGGQTGQARSGHADRFRAFRGHREGGQAALSALPAGCPRAPCSPAPPDCTPAESGEGHRAGTAAPSEGRLSVSSAAAGRGPQRSHRVPRAGDGAPLTSECSRPWKSPARSCLDRRTAREGIHHHFKAPAGQRRACPRRCLLGDHGEDQRWSCGF